MKTGSCTRVLLPTAARDGQNEPAVAPGMLRDVCGRPGTRLCWGGGSAPRYPRSNARELRRLLLCELALGKRLLKDFKSKKRSYPRVLHLSQRGLTGGGQDSTAAPVRGVDPPPRLQPRRVGAADLPSAPKPPLTEGCCGRSLGDKLAF